MIAGATLASIGSCSTSRARARVGARALTILSKLAASRLPPRATRGQASGAVRHSGSASLRRDGPAEVPRVSPVAVLLPPARVHGIRCVGEEHLDDRIVRQRHRAHITVDLAGELVFLRPILPRLTPSPPSTESATASSDRGRTPGGPACREVRSPRSRRWPDSPCQCRGTILLRQTAPWCGHGRRWCKRPAVEHDDPRIGNGRRGDVAGHASALRHVVGPRTALAVDGVDLVIALVEQLDDLRAG